MKSGWRLCMALCAWFLALTLVQAWAQNQWEPASEDLGNLNVQALGVNNSNEVFAGTQGGGVWRSTDGRHWMAINEGLTSSTAKNISSLAVTPDGSIFAGTCYRVLLDVGVWEGCGSGIFRYVPNNGTSSWIAVNQGILHPNYPIMALAVDASGRIYASNQDGYYQSLDNGDHWTQLVGSMVNGARRMSIVDGKVLLCGTIEHMEGGRIECYDPDKGWINRKALSWQWVSALGINLQTGDYFAGLITKNIYGPYNLLRSTDKGKTWTPTTGVGISHMGWAPNPEPPPQFLTGEIFPAINSLISRPGGELFAGLSDNQGIWRSVDDGQTWQDVSQGLTDKTIQAMVVDSLGTIYAATASGVFRSTDSVPCKLAEFQVD